MNYFIILIWIIWILSAVLARTIAIKRGANSLAWTITGFSAGPFALPFVFFSRKKNDP